MKMCKFPHIEQFRNVIRRVKDKTRYSGKDENGEPIFNANIRLPILKFIGTPKIHGTNSGVVVNKDGEYWAQSRERIITPESDNMGFATFVYSNREYFTNLGKSILDNCEPYDAVAFYGEWCGKGIQAGVSVSQLDKMFVIFSIKLITYDEDLSNTWMDKHDVKSLIENSDERKIYNIYQFGDWDIEIDFENPELSSNKMIEWVEQVENECPVGKYFGVSGIGEGIVFHCEEHPYTGGDFMFKIKGEKHSVSKVKTLAPVDIEKVNSVKGCVEKIITENRLQQGLEHLRLNNLEYIPENIGTFIKWVTSDAIREELDTIVESGLIPKDVGGAASKVARDWFFKTTQMG